MSVQCFVINLPHDQARRLAISTQLEQAKLPYTMIAAVNGRELSGAALAQSYNKELAIKESHDLTLGEIGCALSHISVYREIVRRNIPHALVLEDDARLGDNVGEILESLAQLYSPQTPQVVMLNYVEKYKKLGMIALGPNHQVVSTYGGNKNAHGYFITRAAAKKMAEQLFPVWLVADRWERFKEKKIIRVKALLPYCIGLTEHAVDSNLTQDRVARMELFRRGGFFYFVHRYLYKKFLYQIFVRPVLRVARQKETW